MINIQATKRLESKKVITYPWIGQWENIVVLFTNKSNGVCLQSSYLDSVGKYEEGWSEYLYTPYTGSLTISNASVSNA